MSGFSLDWLYVTGLKLLNHMKVVEFHEIIAKRLFTEVCRYY